jgi:GTP-binding protein EngB required for normal cell division
MTALFSVGPSRLAPLSARLDALAELVKIGRARDGFSAELLDSAEEVLRRAGERLRLSGDHTVVALAGGTGTGKSLLFNALAGAAFSPSGVTRPATRHVHACVWGMQGAGPLLDWLGVQRRHRYARASALDSGESALNGLLLLDLPDHDSVVTASMAAVDRLSRLADMVIWVLDPQKYADAAVHNRYLIPLAGHASVFVVVLNQIDLLDDQQRADCEDDLRRLLDSEGLSDTPLLAVSARTGEGVQELRALLAREVSASHAAGARIAADIDAIIGKYAVYAGGPAAPERAVPLPAAPGAGPGTAGDAAAAAAGDTAGDAIGPLPVRKAVSRPPWEISGTGLADPVSPADREDLAGRADREDRQRRPPWEDAVPGDDGARQDSADLARNVPDGPAAGLTTAFGAAAGAFAMAEQLAADRERLAARYTGWPVALLRGRTGRPVPARDRAVPAGNRAIADGNRVVPGGNHAVPGEPQQADVDNAITAFAEEVGGKLPPPWPATVRKAARSRAGEVPAALAAATARAVPDTGKVPFWWRLIAAWQWLLTALGTAAVSWAVVIAVVHGGQQRSTLLGDLSLIPWLVAAAAAMLLLGWLTASACRNAVVLSAERVRARAEQEMREQIAIVTRDLVLAPAGAEIGEYERFRRALALAGG